MPIQVLRPQLPQASRLLSYLRRIDEARTYTNWGPLASELERRLASEVGLPEGAVTLAASGTAALAGAVSGMAGRATSQTPLAIVPAYTFVATPLAAEQSGFSPYLADIDSDRWTLDARLLERHPKVGKAGLVIPVAPFGRAVPQAPWQEFKRRTGIPVVIDGGASFEAILENPAQFLGSIPVALSFHATKSFSTAEGGCVLSADREAVQTIGASLNFGFAGSRDCKLPSTNGKMSEYHAAVGLAELDGWAEKRAALLDLASRYRARLRECGLAGRFVGAPDVAGCYALFCCHDRREARRVIHALSEAAVETRLWYGEGLHRQTYFSPCERDDLPVTDDLAPRVIGLPVAPDLTTQEIHSIVTALVRGMAAVSGTVYDTKTV